MLSGDRQIGLIGLANRLDGYTARLAEELEPLLQTVGNLIERKWLYQEKREHQKHLEQVANFDAFTGLPNRRRLTTLFEQELFEAKQRKGLVSVCFIDLDGFEAIARLQAQEIKIDRSFVMDMLENNDNYMIVSAIVSLSQSFQRRLVAEGVESAAVEAKLIELGCELGQGFFYSRPMPLEWASSFTWDNRSNNVEQ